jgi:predicted transcriptional regulator
MKQILIELDEATAKRLEAVAPARSRRRSQFIREAVRRLLDELEERGMEAAYRRAPDVEPAHFDPALWETRRGRRK